MAASVEIETLLAAPTAPELDRWCADHGKPKPAYVENVIDGRAHCTVLCDELVESAEEDTREKAREIAIRKLIDLLGVRYRQLPALLESARRATETERRFTDRGIPVYVVPYVSAPTMVDLGRGPIVMTPSLQALRDALQDRR